VIQWDPPPQIDAKVRESPAEGLIYSGWHPPFPDVGAKRILGLVWSLRRSGSYGNGSLTSGDGWLGCSSDFQAIAARARTWHSDLSGYLANPVPSTGDGFPRTNRSLAENELPLKKYRGPFSLSRFDRLNGTAVLGFPQESKHGIYFVLLQRHAGCNDVESARRAVGPIWGRARTERLVSQILNLCPFGLA